MARRSSLDPIAWRVRLRNSVASLFAVACWCALLYVREHSALVVHSRVRYNSALRGRGARLIAESNGPSLRARGNPGDVQSPPVAPCQGVFNAGSTSESGSAADGIADPAHLSARRTILGGIACGCLHCLSGASPAHAEAVLKTVPADLIAAFDQPRDRLRDAGFAKGMSLGMVKYEAAVAERKQSLFKKLFAELPQKRDLTIVELGMGTFPNAKYFAEASAPPEMDIIGVDPNDFMKKYALESASKAGLEKLGHKVRLVHGVTEALPFEDGSVDAVVCTLTLCSVPDVARGLSEIKRVLRPGAGRFLFLEHVLSETDPVLASMQKASTPMQVKKADGCHLDRRTLQSIRDAGFPGGVDGEYFELSGLSYLNPTVVGIASA